MQMDAPLRPRSMCHMSGQTTARCRTSTQMVMRWHHTPSRKSVHVSSAVARKICYHCYFAHNMRFDISTAGLIL